MTSFIEDEKVFGAMRAGATGYVLKDAEPEEVVKAIHSAAHGESPSRPACRAEIDAGVHPCKAQTRDGQRTVERARD